MINAIALAIYTKLAAVITTYHIIVKQTATLPYATYGLITDTPIGTFASPSAIEDTTWWVNVFSSTGSKDAGIKAGLVMGALDNVVLNPVGYTALKCVREFIGSPIYDPETGVYQIPLRYRVWVDKD